MGKKRERVKKQPKYPTYQYVTYTDENGTLRQAFEEVKINGYTENRVIELGEVPHNEQLDEQEDIAYQCDEDLDPAEQLLVQQYLKGQQKQEKQPEDVTERNYEVELPEPTLNVQFENSQNSYLSDDENYQIDVKRPIIPESDFVKELPKATSKIVPMKKEGKEFLINQLFGDVDYSESEISDCDEVKQAVQQTAVQDNITAQEQREINDNMAFFEADFNNQEEENSVEECSNSFSQSHSSDIGLLEQGEEEHIVTQEELNMPIGVRPIEEKYLTYEEGQGELVIHENVPIVTLKDKLQISSQQKQVVNENQIIRISKKTKGVVQQQDDLASDEEQQGVQIQKVVLPHYRNRNETKEERQQRKDAIKEAKQLRRQNNQLMKQLINDEKQKVEFSKKQNAGNVQGVRIQ